jgi:hypothetical protein
MNKIIAEIDEYLVRLELARDLLARVNRIDAPRKASTKQRPSRATQPPVALPPRGTRLQASEPRGTRERSSTNEDGPVDTVSKPESSAADTSSVTNNSSPLTLVETQIPVKSVEPLIKKTIVAPSRSYRATRPRASIVKPPTSRPAIEHSDSSQPKIVVLSPEEAKRARERVVQPAPIRRFTSGAPPTGKRAFEALFRD